MKTQLTLLFLFLFTIGASAQMRVLKGDVFLFEDLKVQNVLVEAKNSGANAISDSLGKFSIVCEQNDVLKFKGKIFKPKKFKVTPKTDSVVVTLRLKDSPNIIDKAVQNGYISASDVSYAKSQITQDDVDFCKYNDIYDLIEGRVAGVQVLSNHQILIRGNTSLLGNNSALLVVDGREVSSISHISPCDVKKIDFLKSGAGSIYSSRGANGVIIIETKSSGNN